MFEDLDKLISTVQKNYDHICQLWDEKCPCKIHLKKTRVSSVRENADILNKIIEYRALLNEETISSTFEINMLKYQNSSVTTRVKAQNSIEYKIENYYTNHENGKIPLKKCLNDLFGIRIVIDGKFGYDDIVDFLSNRFPGYKCIDSSKNGYNATHIYFEKGNEYFPWELQVWQKADEKNNYASHRRYKQEYTSWESLNKGGVEDDKAFCDIE